jgi:hypothetical protein
MLHLPPYHMLHPPYQVATLSGGDCFGEIAQLDHTNQYYSRTYY